MSRRQDRITDEAALWFVRAQDSEFSASDAEEFASWLAASAEHVQAYLSVASVTHDIREAAAAYDVDELVTLARKVADDQNVVALLGPDASLALSAGDDYPRDVALAQASKVGGRRPMLWAAAAGVVLAVIAGTFGFLQLIAPDPDLYTTGVGEQVSFPLGDGSVVTLNAQSTLRVAYGDAFRDIRLIAGEAMFDVEKDPDRAFRVITDRAVIQAIGTQFNVRSRGGGTTITVVEGIVDVRSTPGPSASPGAAAQTPAAADPPPAVSEPRRLTVGQQARVDGGEVAVIEASVQKATSWRERRLVFEVWALEDVVAEFNLYNDQQFVISDPDLASRAISGAFSADDRESFALFLSEAGLARSDTLADGTIVLLDPRGVE